VPWVRNLRKDFMSRTLRLPPIGEGVSEARVVSIPPRIHNLVQKDEPYLIIETSKVELEVPAPYDFVVEAIHVVQDQTVHSGDSIMAVMPRADLGLCEVRERRSNVATGLRYILGRDPRRLCCRAELGKHSFEDLVPFMLRVSELTARIAEADLDKMSDASTVDLQDTLYHVTQFMTQIDDFGRRGNLSAEECLHLTRMVSDFQGSSLVRLLRAVAHASGKAVSEQRETNEACAVFNPGRAYVFLSHANTDKKVAKRIAKKLYAANVAYFLDESNIPWGGQIPASVHVALRRASHVLAIVTVDAVHPWVAYEVGFARGAEKEVVPYVMHVEISAPGFMTHVREVRTTQEFDKFVRYLQTFKRTPSISTR
jgi:hypothetical protein